MIQSIRSPSSGETLAIIVTGVTDLQRVSADFFTTPDQPLQVGKLSRPKGHIVPMHSHTPVKREVTGTSEVLYILSGAVHFSLLDEEGTPLTPFRVRNDTLVILLRGSHRLEMTEDTELIEVKQGPYLGAKDKVYR